MEVLINVESIADIGDENLSKTILSNVSSAEELLQDVPAVERSAELARPFSSGGRSIIVGYARELDDVVPAALLVRKVPSGRAGGVIGPDELATSALMVQKPVQESL